MILEACTGAYMEVVKAVNNGANRIELCGNLGEGGTTPSYGIIKKTIETINLPINIIIRPRGGNFIYNKEEKEIMFTDIEMCKSLGASGLVIGSLTYDKKVDVEFISKAKVLAGGLNITFHMAFDEIENKKEAIDILVDLKIDRILTKGGTVSALENLESLKELIGYADNRIILIPGAGINENNRDMVIEVTGAKEIHGTKIVGNLK
ncbi:copper homeostasis protein CutC [Clostridium gasigenes]|uniref:PF03932 family protein CutC n=1 Tax=Clostridium gasigenes TaxID=94869 RepID=A0A1H0SV56_9CLOT|nr:copper homeostasis protein CutC [Clostridium gasigenes]MBB6625644.1 copper homeostasis protein CutC [Clostridium gasigenes]MBU3090447.1 copper homeostasis protein CutC [Clostridium gasigenes]MBU3133652.1 copper homeostasis protein CutC [Clostridium gasigenes]SDP45647.1 copper homeostasis protein [Clostridium gasigenes]